MTGSISKGNTTWMQLPFSSYFESHSGTGIDLYARKSGKVVTIVGCIAPTQTISGSSDVVHITESTLPSDFCPIANARAIQKGNASNIWLCTVTTDGYVNFSRYRNTSSYASVYQGAQLFVNITYMTAD